MNDLINIFILHFMAFSCAMIGFIYSDVLTEPDMIFYKLFKFLELWLYPEFEWLFKPLIGCFRCVSGQIALWTFFILNFYHGDFFKAIFLHIYYICLTIYLSWIISKTYRN